MTPRRFSIFVLVALVAVPMLSQEVRAAKGDQPAASPKAATSPGTGTDMPQRDPLKTMSPECQKRFITIMDGFLAKQRALIEEFEKQKVEFEKECGALPNFPKFNPGEPGGGLGAPGGGFSPGFHPGWNPGGQGFPPMAPDKDPPPSHK